jgi:hypothetical protein
LLVPLIALLLFDLLVADSVAVSSSLHKAGTTKMPSILSLSSLQPITFPVRLPVQDAQLQAFADINKLYPHGMASMNCGHAHYWLLKARAAESTGR